MIDTKFFKPCSPPTAAGVNFWLYNVPFDACAWSSFATELDAAVGPLTSLPWRGDTPSANGSVAKRPSGNAATSLPNKTFADTG